MHLAILAAAVFLLVGAAITDALAFSRFGGGGGRSFSGGGSRGSGIAASNRVRSVPRMSGGARTYTPRSARMYTPRGMGRGARVGRAGTRTTRAGTRTTRAARTARTNRSIGRIAGQGRRVARNTRMPGQRVRPQRPNRVAAVNQRTPNYPKDGRQPPKTQPPHYPPGRVPPSKDSSNTRPPSGGTYPPGCRGDCPKPPPETRPPQRPPERPPYHPPHRPPVVVVPPFTPPVPPPVVVVPPSDPSPPSMGPGPATASSSGGARPPARVAQGGGGGGGAARPPQPPIRRAGGPPPAGERRYVPDQVVVILRDDIGDREVDRFLRQHQLSRTANGSQRIALLGARIYRFRIANRRLSVPAVVSAIQNDPRIIAAQPNYVYQLSEDAPRPAGVPARRVPSNASMQYTVTKLQLRQAHELALGERVLIAVIDSGVDSAHPELEGAVYKEIDVVETKDRAPHSHGTAMAGAIASRAQLMGVAPEARVLAIRAFSPKSTGSAQGTSYHLAMAIDRAVQEGARVINLSLAGPQDPLIQQAVEQAHAMGIILVAAAGNAGPRAAPMYPAAYPSVIAVTATDAYDRLYDGANRGNYIAVSAPGVDVLVPAPGRAYGVTTGTSVAAAHVSGVIALMLARNPQLDPDAARAILVRSVRRAAADARDEEYGAGHANAYQATVTAEPTQPQGSVAEGAPATQ